MVALSTFYLRQLGTQVCLPPWEVSRGGSRMPRQPEPCEDLWSIVVSSQRDRNRGDVCLPACLCWAQGHFLFT